MHLVTQVTTEKAMASEYSILLSKVAYLRMFLHQQWAGAEDGEGFRPVAGTRNE